MEMCHYGYATDGLLHYPNEQCFMVKGETDTSVVFWLVFLWVIAVRALEKAKGNTTLQASYTSSDSSLYTNPKGSTVSAFDGGSDSSSESEPEEPPNRKKLRVEPS